MDGVGESNDHKNQSKLTISTHANSDAFLMAAILAPVSTSLVDYTVATFCTSIVDFVDL